jgi:hypothetical protein
MMDRAVFKAKILTNSSIDIANASLFEILYKWLSEYIQFSSFLHEQCMRLRLRPQSLPKSSPIDMWIKCLT